MFSQKMMSLENGKYLFRPNNIVNYIMQLLDTDKYTVYSDIPLFTVGVGLYPQSCVFQSRSQILSYKIRKTNLSIYCELTVPTDRNIDTRHAEKSNKYAHFLTDMSAQ